MIKATPLKLAAKTFIQAFLAVLIVAITPLLADLTAWANGSDLQLTYQPWIAALISATVAGIAALLSYAQNKLTEWLKIR